MHEQFKSSQLLAIGKKNRQSQGMAKAVLGVGMGANTQH